MTSRGPNPRRREQAGLTLVELMVVLVLVSVGVLAIAAIQTRSADVVAETGRETQALSVAQSRIESARSAGWANAQPDSGVLGAFDWRADVDSIRPGLSQGTSTVGWREEGLRRTVELNTLLSDR